MLMVAVAGGALPLGRVVVAALEPPGDQLEIALGEDRVQVALGSRRAGLAGSQRQLVNVAVARHGFSRPRPPPASSTNP